MHRSPYRHAIQNFLCLNIDERIIKIIKHHIDYREKQGKGLLLLSVHGRLFYAVRFIVEKFPQRPIACAKATEGEDRSATFIKRFHLQIAYAVIKPKIKPPCIARPPPRISILLKVESIVLQLDITQCSAPSIPIGRIPTLCLIHLQKLICILVRL